MVMHPADNTAIAALSALEPFGNSSDGRGAQASFFLDNGVWNAFSEHLSGAETLREFLNLVRREKVAQKATRFVCALERQNRPHKCLLLWSVPIHSPTLVDYSTLVK